MLLWIAGCLNPKEMRSKILENNSIWQKKVIAYLESCHTGDFQTGTQEDVIKEVATKSKLEGYCDPTQTLPEPPSPKCGKSHHKSDETCKVCIKNLTWWQRFRSTVDDLIFKSNVHSCNKGQRKDGSRRKNKTFTGCRDNKWNRCKARFPRAIVKESGVDDTGAIHLKKSESWINTFTPIVTYLYRCNTDVTSLNSGTAIKEVVLYVSDYITKSTLKTHTIFDSIKSVFHKSSEMIGGSLPSQEKARRIMTKVVNLLSAKAEMGAPMICMYLLGNPDHYTNYSFVPFYWQSFVAEARKDFEASDIKETQKITLIKRKGKIMGLSPVYDYIYRSPALENLCLYDWVQCYERKKVQKPKKVQTNEDNIDPVEIEAADISNLSFESNIDEGPDGEKIKASAQSVFRFIQQHPLHDSHASKYIANHEKRVPNFIGATLPRCDQGDRNYYCSTMLALFKPWRKGHDLKSNNLETWDECFNHHVFTDQQQKLMKNFNIKYECLDARDNYRTQLKKGGVEKSLIGSWEMLQDEDTEEIINSNTVPDTNIEYDDLPFDPTSNGKNHFIRLKNLNMIRMIMDNIGWSNPKNNNLTTNSEVFRPDIILSGKDWEDQVQKKKQDIYDKKQQNNKANQTQNSQANNLHMPEPEAPNLVKIVDKSYLEKSFNAGKNKQLIDDVATKFSLNTEQEKAFRIISNHA
ncbi:hypothetical protein GALMADRAFT_62402, partial [Galerina marginata CBS 339.88]